jgi:pyruvate dehydrogenase E1 component alpha subunit
MPSHALQRRAPQKELRQWADGYGVPSWRVDGNDIEAVVGNLEQAVEIARSGGGPSLIEFVTYRWQGHFAGDPRPTGRKRNSNTGKNATPFLLARNVLKEREGVSEEELQSIEGDVNAQIQEMLRFSLESPVLMFRSAYARI